MQDDALQGIGSNLPIRDVSITFAVANVLWHLS